MKKLVVFYWIFISVIYQSAYSQDIHLNNPSFEGVPHYGGGDNNIGIKGWFDCGAIQFPDETPPDVHPVNFWRVTRSSFDGMTYLGMVVRDNDSWEAVSQRLPIKMLKDKCYTISAHMARSSKYVSGSQAARTYEGRERMVNYTVPSVLRIWGGTGICGRQELLAESIPVESENWLKYNFKLRPNRNISYITFEVFYQVPVIVPYNGHILLDGLSSLEVVSCEEDLASIIEKRKNESTETIAESKLKTKNDSSSDDTQKVDELIVVNTPSRSVKKAIPEKVTGLGFESIKVGQIIKLNKLNFEMNKADLNKEAFDELDRLYHFLLKYPYIKIEIGGHTNTIPPKEWCQKLSEKRAQAVSDYLINKGVSPNQITYRGYGKSNPINSNDKHDFEARKMNQRVEVKILQLG